MAATDREVVLLRQDATGEVGRAARAKRNEGEGQPGGGGVASIRHTTKTYLETVEPKVCIWYVREGPLKMCAVVVFPYCFAALPVHYDHVPETILHQQIGLTSNF